MAKSLVLGLLLLSLSIATAQDTFEVYVGYSSNATDSWEFLQFFPETLYVKAGDSVLFTNYGHIHTVTFNPESTDLFNGTDETGDFFVFSDYLLPVGDANLTSVSEIASSGVLLHNQSYTVNFLASGVYNYICLFHYPIMQGRIIVLENNDNSTNSTDVLDETHYISPEESDALVDSHLELLETKVVPDLNIVKGVDVDVPASRFDGSLGATIWTVRMEGDYFSKATIPRFLPGEFTISVGDIVEFVNDDIDPHTVSFNTSGIYESEMTFDAEANRFLFNSAFLVPSNGTFVEDYSEGFISSGILLPLYVPYTSVNATLNRYFSVRFTAPGTYPYRCDLHYEAGMTGEITVSSPTPTVPPPSTSSAFTSSSSDTAETSSAGTTPSGSGSSIPETSASGTAV